MAVWNIKVEIFQRKQELKFKKINIFQLCKIAGAW